MRLAAGIILTTAGLVSGTALVTPGTARAADYVDASPLASQVRAAPRDCRVSTEFPLPMITWGADIVTLQAQEAGYFQQEGLKPVLERQDDFAKQVEDYVNCRTPFLRATVGMAMQAVDVTEKNPATSMQAMHQLSWSVGGDAIVVKPEIRRPEDLCKATIALQQYGPHVDYLFRVLSDACDHPAPTLKWVKDLSGSSESTPAAAFSGDSTVDAAMVIIPDALALTSDGTVGTGSEGSVKGARILMSTKTASRIIADSYFVRKDFADAHPEVVAGLSRALLKAEKDVRALVREKNADYRKLMSIAADKLLDLPGLVEEAQALYADAETLNAAANISFFNPSSPRSFKKLSSEIQEAYLQNRLISRQYDIAQIVQNYEQLLGETVAEDKGQRFNVDKVESLVSGMRAQDQLESGTLFSFQIHFKPNQSDFPASIYGDRFDRVIELASTYGGAVVVLEGHADPLGYLKAMKKGEPEMTLRRIVQAARSLSGQRAVSARQSVLDYAGSQGIALDASQFTTAAAGISSPLTGMCGKDPCAPKTKEEWLSNMRVVVRVIGVEAESDVFVPLD